MIRASQVRAEKPAELLAWFDVMLSCWGWIVVKEEWLMGATAYGLW